MLLSDLRCFMELAWRRALRGLVVWFAVWCGFVGGVSSCVLAREGVEPDATEGAIELRDLELDAPTLAPVANAVEDGGGHPNLGKELGLWTMLPFVGTLLSIALLPLFAGHWWEHNRNKGIIAALFAVPVAVYLAGAFSKDGAHVLLEAVMEYIPFIILLGSLFVITGGIVVEGSLSGTPLLNTGIMALGAIIANVIGTTGASVLLIRPLSRANAPR